MIPVFNILLAVSGFFVLFSFILLFFRIKGQLYKWPLFVWYVSLLIFLGSICIVANHLESRFFHWLNLSEIWAVLPAMVLYHFFICLSKPFKPVIGYIKDYLPFFGLLLTYLLLGEYWHITIFPHRFIQVFSVSINFGYSILLLLQLHRFQKFEGLFFSSEVIVPFNWLKITTLMFVGLLIVQTIGMLYQTFGGFIPQYGNLYANIFLCGLVTVSCFFALRQKVIFRKKDEYQVFYELKGQFDCKGLLPEMQTLPQDNGIYTALPGEESIHTEFSDLNSFVSRNTLYLNPDINLTQLAFAYGEPAYKITRILSKEGLNFYEFINQFRIEAVIAEFKLGKTKDLTIFAIAQAAGFKSKASFNRIFKQFKHKTPREFIDSLDEY